jgi:hypothetical protein
MSDQEVLIGTKVQRGTDIIHQVTGGGDYLNSHMIRTGNDHWRDTIEEVQRTGLGMI